MELLTSNMTSDLLRYEQGELDEEEVVALFQKLVDTGIAWELQGHYGRMAAALIDAGMIEVEEGR